MVTHSLSGCGLSLEIKCAGLPGIICGSFPKPMERKTISVTSLCLEMRRRRRSAIALSEEPELQAQLIGHRDICTP